MRFPLTILAIGAALALFAPVAVADRSATKAEGGGIGECHYWRKRAPRSVLRDLDIHGLVDVSSGTEGNCG